MLRRRLPVAALLTTLAVAPLGCGGSEDQARPIPVTTEPTSSPSTTAADAFAVPETIDVAYVQRVVDELYGVASDAMRLTVQQGEVTPEVSEMLRSVFVDGNAAIFEKQLRGMVAADFAGLHRPPGDMSATISGVRSADPSCVEVEATLDTSAVFVKPVDPGALVLVLAERPASEAESNPTPWRLVGAFAADSFEHTVNGCGRS